MPDKHTTLCDHTIFGIPRLKKTLSRNHAPYRRQGGFRITMITGTSERKFGIGKFEIRQKNIHVLGVARNQIRVLQPGAVEKKRQRFAGGAQAAAQLLDMRPKMVGRDEVDVMHAGMNQVLRDAIKFVIGHNAAKVLNGNLIVLTEETLTGTTAEKYRAGAMRAAKTRFFPKMRARIGNSTYGGFPAEANLAGAPIHTAAARTQITFMIAMHNSNRIITPFP